MYKIEKLFCVPVEQWMFNACEPAEVIGVAMVSFNGGDPRPFFKIRFNDGVEGMVPIFAGADYSRANPLYKFITETDAREGRIPKAT